MNPEHFIPTYIYKARPSVHFITRRPFVCGFFRMMLTTILRPPYRKQRFIHNGMTSTSTYQIYHSNIFKCKPSSYFSHLLPWRPLIFFGGVNRFPKILLAWLQCPRSIHRQSWGTKAWWCHHRILRIDPRCNGNMAKVQDCWNVDGEPSLLGCPWKLVTT